MDMQRLVEEIAVRVKERMAEEPMEWIPEAVCNHHAEKLVLVVNRKECADCGKCWRKAEKLKGFRVACIQSESVEHPDADTKAIVALHLTELDIMKIAAGVASDRYTETLVSGLMQGIPVFVPVEYMEISSYVPASAKRYRALFEEKKRFLESCGVQFIPEKEIVVYLNTDEKNTEERHIVPPPNRLKENERKRLLTERSIRDAELQGQSQIIISRKTIVTDLAKEYACKRNIELVCCD